MASTYKRGKTYWARVQREGKEYRHSLKTTVEAIARKRLKIWLDKLDADEWGGKGSRLFDEAAEKFQLEHLPHLKPSSRRRYEVSLDHLCDHLEGKQLTKIGRADLSSFVAKRRAAKVSSPTIRRDLACLSSMFSSAIDWEWVEVNPVPAFMRANRKKGLRENPPRTRYLSHDEERRLLATASTDPRDFAALSIDTGLREQELLKLTWEHVDLERREITVEGKRTKSNQERKVPLLPRAASILGTRPRHIRLPYIFWNEDTKEPYTTLDKGFRAAARRAGVKGVQVHDLRRTCGCRRLQDDKLSMEEVSLWLGHSSVTVTERTYAFLRIDDLHAAVGTKTGTDTADSW